MRDVTVILGAQLGDEGKGRVSDYYSAFSDIIVRVQGGNNAGHTIKVGDQTYKLHHLPCGVVRNKPCLLGPGMLVDPFVLLDELDKINCPELVFIDGRANIILPSHILLDEYEEKQRNVGIGTTKRGIGPAASFKYARMGVQFWDLINGTLEEKIRAVDERISAITGLKFPSFHNNTLFHALNRLISSVVDGRHLLQKYNKILVEGAQGFLLDIDYGNYPFVTSSHTTFAGALLGTGISLNDIDQIIGVAKAYNTYVGNGNFIGEMEPEVNEYVAQKGNEFGTTTGRRRRCGWLDLVALKESVLANGSDVIMTKLDVLSGLDEVKVVINYSLDGQIIDYIPSNPAAFERCQPVYKIFTGWEKFDAVLPDKAKEYVQFISDYLMREGNSKLLSISVGPERNQMIDWWEYPDSAYN